MKRDRVFNFMDLFLLARRYDNLLLNLLDCGAGRELAIATDTCEHFWYWEGWKNPANVA